MADCDLVIEAVFEQMDVKKDIFGRLDRICKPGAILASNTSYLNIDEIAASTSRPQDVVGLHFFSPANVMKLLEVVRGAKTADDVLVTAMALAKKIGKVAVVAGVCHGFIGNRMLMPRQVEATKLLLEGASPEQVDRVHVEFGMPMGPFQMADLAGVDIGWHRDPTRIENVWNLRIKETDRLSALTNELRRLGATVEEGHDYLVVEPLALADARPADVRTYGDHRMAMAFALAGLRLPGVVILEPACVTKTFPAFFDVLAAL